MYYDYYIFNNLVYRLKKGNKLHGNVSTLQVFESNKWSSKPKYLKSFMNQYVTGWIDERDAIPNFEEAKEQLAIVKYNMVKDFAIESHRNQKYGIYNYEVHLTNVISVFFRNSVFISYENYPILASAWLHDILEDTAISKEEFIDRFGNDIYNIVWSLTDGKEGNRVEKKNIMYDKLVNSQNGIIVKLADRIANLEFSIINQNIKHINRYVKENKELNIRLSNIIQTELGSKLLNDLNLLVEQGTAYLD
ncbi:MAG: hypothetical protein OIF50_16945 [Flavobacteriaceae bacterium]|nr:hypothetical protein [Flavobacteriaceae bacterium]